MDCYKKMNRDLALANQNLKVENNAFLKEVVSLRTKLMEEQEKRVTAQKKLKMILIENFKIALKEVDPESSFLEMLCDRDSGGGQNHQKGMEKHKILEELRNSLALERRSSIACRSMSPTRRSSLRTSSITSQETSNENPDQEQEETTVTPDGSSEHGVDEYSEETVVSNTRGLGCINEDESEEEDEQDEEDSDEPYDVDESQNQEEESENESCEENITEVQKDPSPESISIRVPTRRRNVTTCQRSPLQDLINLNNTTEESPTSVKIPYIVVRRGKRRSCKNDSIEVARHMKSPHRNSFLNDEELPTTHGISLLEPSGRVESFADISATTSALSEFSLKQFNDAHSSTPNNSHMQTTGDEFSVRTRSRRKCTPKNLAEPSLRDKMRNESQKESKKNARKKK